MIVLESRKGRTYSKLPKYPKQMVHPSSNTEKTRKNGQTSLSTNNTTMRCLVLIAEFRFNR